MYLLEVVAQLSSSRMQEKVLSIASSCSTTEMQRRLGLLLRFYFASFGSSHSHTAAASDDNTQIPATQRCDKTVTWLKVLTSPLLLG